MNNVSHNEDYEKNNNKIIQLLDLNLLDKKSKWKLGRLVRG